MKVCFIDKSTWWAGAEVCLASMAKYTKKQGIDVEILTNFPQLHHENYKKDGVVVKNRFSALKWWMYERWRKPVKGLDFIGRVIKSLSLYFYLLKSKPDIVHFNLLRRTDKFDILVAKKLGIKVIGHVRSLHHQGASPSSTANLCDAIICISDYVKKECVDQGYIVPLYKVYDGVEVNKAIKEHSQDINKLIIVFPAVLERRKGQLDAIHAFAIFNKKYSNAQLIIAGEEPKNLNDNYKNELVNLIKNYDLELKIKLIGHCSNMEQLYQQADIVLALSTDGEAYGRVPVEAAMYKKTTIATAVGATPELIIPDETGYLVSPSSPNMISDKLLTLSKKSDCEKMGMNAYNHACSKFGFNSGSKKIINVYHDVLKNE